MAIKLVIGCCSYLFGEGLKKLLENGKNIDVLGIFDESTDLEEIAKLNVDIILADHGVFHSFPDDFVIQKPIKILLIADRTWPTTEEIAELISRGVVGILPPGSDSVFLKKALKAVSQGELWIERKTVKDMLTSKPPEKEINLTAIEKKVIYFICEGYRNKEIAQKLNISEQTVKSHCNRIYKKVGVSDKLKLALYFCRTKPDWIQSISKKV
jgi:DNA-binding NarL/FixJ family response regulator